MHKPREHVPPPYISAYINLQALCTKSKQNTITINITTIQCNIIIITIHIIIIFYFLFLHKIVLVSTVF